MGGFKTTPCKYFSTALLKIRYHRCSPVNCSALLFRDEKNVDTRFQRIRTLSIFPCMLLTLMCVCPACEVCFPTACNNKGRLVMASKCLSGSASLTNKFHQL